MVAHSVEYPNWRELAEEEGWLHQIKNVSDERAAAAGYRFDQDIATVHCNFFETVLCHTRGKMAGQPFKLLKWQRDDVIGPLYGWVHRETGLRRFRKGAVWVPKKNGKSTLAGGIIHDALHLGGQRAEAYGFAFTSSQSRIVFNEAAAFLKSSEFLNEHSRVNKSVNRITVPYNDSFYEARAGEAGKQAAEGINPVLIIFDELHVQRTRDLWDAVTYACAAQEEPLILSISTVGVADETTIWWEQYEYSKRILSGEITDHSFFAYIAQADEACKDNIEMLLDPVQQKKANPSLDEPGCPTSEELTQAVIEAKNSPRKINNLLRYRFNIPTAQIDRVVNVALWDNGAVSELPDLSHRRAFAGLDLASVEDLTSLVLYFEATEDEQGFYLPFFWCPEEKMRERELKGKSHYTQWANDGWIETTPGKRINHAIIRRRIGEISEQFHIAMTGYDKWNAEAMVQSLELDMDMVEFNQSIRGMTAGTKAFLDDIEEERIKHNGSPVLRWCLSNCAADKRSNEDYIRFSREDSADKIDGAICCAMARGLAVSAEPETESIYSEPGGLFL